MYYILVLCNIICNMQSLPQILVTLWENSSGVYVLSLLEELLNSLHTSDEKGGVQGG